MCLLKKNPKEKSDFWNSENGGHVSGQAAAKRVHCTPIILITFLKKFKIGVCVLQINCKYQKCEYYLNFDFSLFMTKIPAGKLSYFLPKYCR